jgi:hypothetical protein
MTRRTVLASSVAALTLLSGANMGWATASHAPAKNGVSAAKKKPAPPKRTPRCKIVTDPSGDTNWQDYRSHTNGADESQLDVDAEDITSVDVATGQKTFVAVLRLKTTDLSDPKLRQPSAPEWQVRFTIHGVNYHFERIADANDASSLQSGPHSFTDTLLIGPATSSTKPAVTMAGNSVTFTVPRSAIPDLTGANVTINGIAGWTGMGGPVDDAGMGAVAAGSYQDRWPSCVNPK